MKKQFTLFAATALAAMTVVPTIGFADDSASKTPITYDSKGTVEFVAPTTPNKPLDPTNPDPNKPLDQRTLMVMIQSQVQPAHCHLILRHHLTLESKKSRQLTRHTTLQRK
ncbi:hypothetical protein [Weissella confusa]|uniref:hypothetical protein n=1 Tax=Weissella confusa TaxID=1583 RepID=UPI00107F5BCB|nr:hypothetical protein [Weissella confusa]TGE76146.1 hypothetical protein C6P10_06225 [Weissella confusa]